MPDEQVIEVSDEAVTTPAAATPTTVTTNPKGHAQAGVPRPVRKVIRMSVEMLQPPPPGRLAPPTPIGPDALHPEGSVWLHALVGVPTNSSAGGTVQPMQLDPLYLYYGSQSLATSLVLSAAMLARSVGQQSTSSLALTSPEASVLSSTGRICWNVPIKEQEMMPKWMHYLIGRNVLDRNGTIWYCDAWSPVAPAHQKGTKVVAHHKDGYLRLLSSKQTGKLTGSAVSSMRAQHQIGNACDAAVSAFLFKLEERWASPQSVCEYRSHSPPPLATPSSLRSSAGAYTLLGRAGGALLRV